MMAAATQPLRLSPRLSHSLRRALVDDFMARQMAQVARGSFVLDLGGHKQVKRGAFDITHYAVQVLYANLTLDKRPDVQADAARTPFASGAFDAVVCTELLEHVPDPQPVLAEIARVLRPGGIVLITAPFLYPIHADPYDFGRYTDTYWRHMLATQGFTQVRVESQGYFFAVLTGMVKHVLNQLLPTGPAGALLRGLLGWGLLAPLHASLWLEPRLCGGRTAVLRSYTTGFGVVAVKP
jgi:SAM-dependent methyltransferase